MVTYKARVRMSVFFDLGEIEAANEVEAYNIAFSRSQGVPANQPYVVEPYCDDTELEVEVEEKP